MPLHTVPTELAFDESQRHELHVASTRRHAPRIRRFVQGLILGLTALSGAGTALAVDGVLEINQLCVASGCFAGDTPGFPVQLASNGSYRLTSQLSVPDENTTAISATADLVTLDLNGFTIRGPVNCSGSPVTSCNFASGTGRGVELNASGNAAGSTVKNGLIQGMGGFGVTCARCTISNVSSRSNRLTGFSQTSGGILSGSSAIANGGFGYSGSGGVLVEDSVAYDNGNDGFAILGGMIRGSVSRNNAGDGITCLLDCNVLDNLVHENGAFGLLFTSGASSRSSYGRNSISGNTSGAVSGTGLQLDSNRCNAALCP